MSQLTPEIMGTTQAHPKAKSKGRGLGRELVDACPWTPNVCLPHLCDITKVYFCDLGKVYQLVPGLIPESSGSGLLLTWQE